MVNIKAKVSVIGVVIPDKSILQKLLQLDEQNILKSYELYNKSDDFSLSDLKDAYSYMRNNIEDYPDKYKMIKDDLKSILIYTLY